MSEAEAEIFFPRCQDQLQFTPDPPLQKAERILKALLVKKTRIRTATDILHLPPACFIKYGVISNFLHTYHYYY
jgi:hypothetical protein